ncbi:hypothetical protein [Marinobacter sp. P4B1]|uniref:hypothetical protein n=1 Tax=Marinobacter sp. P4B1 TaxID=1119533 RepID=UPI00071D2D04|nr:hypothetical protein [Marinobacter sp. P4B1]KRW83716.1 hypothetical protein AQ621_16840 [Marinobacter sp. P4B1]
MTPSMTEHRQPKSYSYIQNPVFQPSNVSVMSKMLQFAMEAFLAAGSSTGKYNSQEAMILLDVEEKLKQHFLIGSAQTLSVSSLNVFFKRLNSYLEEMEKPEGIPPSIEVHSSYRNVMMLSVDWGLVTGMMDIPETITRH